jgi:hypothetical protein
LSAKLRLDDALFRERSYGMSAGSFLLAKETDAVNSSYDCDRISKLLLEAGVDQHQSRERDIDVSVLKNVVFDEKVKNDFLNIANFFL